MNKDAGRGGHLIVTLRLESGAELPVIVDTGSPMTVLDKSLEPRLGPCLGAETLLNFGTQHEASDYAAPRLYLGNTPLVTDSNVLTCDLRKMMPSEADRPIRGILGMDCLQHYCVQLDFRAGKMRFLDLAHVKPVRLGQAFPLTFSSVGNSYARKDTPRCGSKWLLSAQRRTSEEFCGLDLLRIERFFRAEGGRRRCGL